MNGALRVGSIAMVLVACGSSPPPAAPARPASPSVEEGYVTTDDGVRLFYRKIGTGPAVAIVPGAAFYGHDLDRLGERHTVIFYDMRNRGRSDRVDDPNRISILRDVADLERVRSQLGIDRFTPIGWSYLGLMVMLYAVENPQHVSRVIQIGPMARVLGTEFPAELKAKDDPAWSDAAAQAELAKLAASDLPQRDPEAHCRAQWEIFKGSLVGDQRNAARIPQPCVHENEWPRNVDPHFQALFATIATLETPGWDRFAALEFPVLTIHGTQDRQSAYGAGREWATHLTDARLLTVPGAAHMVWIDAPEVVVSAIDEFLAGGWPAAAEDLKARTSRASRP
jgi:pimeloyl-ACP methyl ester carboxylesterase